MERVSIVTVCLNAAACIETAIKSVRAQTYPCIEHIIIDGGSTDGTLEILNRYRAGFAYLLSEPDRGIYHAMNKGINAATGDILFFLNADDCFVDDDTLTDVACVFSQHPTLEIVYGNLIWQVQGSRVRRKQPSMVTREYLAERTILHQTVFARPAVFVSTQGFSERYRVVSDYEWMLKVFLRDQRNYLYYDRDIAIMDTRGRSWTTNWEQERLRVMREYFGFYEILKHRVWPRQKNSWKASFKAFTQRIDALKKRRA
jgi:glycosyltransferase involved in cell wall biosynthesis